jgi:hypothetical protein
MLLKIYTTTTLKYGENPPPCCSHTHLYVLKTHFDTAQHSLYSAVMNMTHPSGKAFIKNKRTDLNYAFQGLDSEKSHLRQAFGL